MKRRDVFLVSENSIKEYSYLDRNFPGDVLTPAIRFVQDSIVERLLGTKLLDKLLFLIESKEIDLPENECYKTLLEGYLFDAIAYSVVAEVQVPSTFKTRSAGSLQVRSDQINNSLLSETKYIENHHRNRADLYVKRLSGYLTCNSSCFPELKECPCVGEVAPKSGSRVNSNFYLGYRKTKKYRG